MGRGIRGERLGLRPNSDYRISNTFYVAASITPDRRRRDYQFPITWSCPQTLGVPRVFKLPRYGVRGCLHLLTFSLGRITANRFLDLNWPDSIFVPAVRRRLAMRRMPEIAGRKAHRSKIKLGLLSAQKISRACRGTPEER